MMTKQRRENEAQRLVNATMALLKEDGQRSIQRNQIIGWLSKVSLSIECAAGWGPIFGSKIVPKTYPLFLSLRHIS